MGNRLLHNFQVLTISIYIGNIIVMIVVKDEDIDSNDLHIVKGVELWKNLMKENTDRNQKALRRVEIFWI